MGAVWVRSRAELRRRWAAWLVILLLAGIGGGIVMGAFAGAERVEDAYPNFVAAGAPMDVLVPGASPFGLVGGVDLTEVGRLPEVAETADASAMLLFAGWTPDGRLIGPGDLFPVATATNALGSTFERWSMLEGRPARQWMVQVTILGALAAATLAHTLLTSVRRRRKSIAILRTMGFARRQVSAVVIVQGLTLVVIALAVGIVLGVIGGRWAWTLFADNLGIEASSVVPWSGLLVLVPAALALAVAVAAIPAWLAARTSPADALHDQ